MKRALFVLLAALLTYQLMADSPPVLKISVSRNGDVAADGKPTTLEALVPLLGELAAKKGVVWYYREAPEEGEPHPDALKVLSAIVVQKLPIRLSTKPDFSDTVDGKGRSVPNK
jgi:hypothetical protein